MDNIKHLEILWLILLLSAMLGTIFTSYRIWLLYTNSGTETVIETTNYKYGNDPFPAVIVCDASRIDWTEVIRLNASDYLSADPEIKKAAMALIKSFATITFGDFDEFDRLKEYNKSISALNSIDITELLFKLQRPCRDVFIGPCWWKKQKFDCCQIFEVHKTEFGFCYSFNSDLSEWSKKRSRKKLEDRDYWIDERTGCHRPRKTANYGKYSGLRVTINTRPQSEMPPGVPNAKPGVKIIIVHPEGFTFGREISVSAGNFAEVRINGDRLYSTERMRGMDVERRNCLFRDEGASLGLDYYMRINCKVDCFRNYTFQYCNCSPNFMFFDLDDDDPKFPNCKVDGLLCLNKHNMIFNNYKPETTTSYFEDDQPGMVCDCPSDCSHQMYKADVTLVGIANSTDDVELDIYFRQSACLLYRSDIIFGWLDLIVSFGGAIGLFLGGSLLSGVEIIYYATFRLFHHFRKIKVQKEARLNNDFEAKTPSDRRLNTFFVHSKLC